MSGCHSLFCSLSLGNPRKSSEINIAAVIIYFYDAVIAHLGRLGVFNMQCDRCNFRIKRSRYRYDLSGAFPVILLPGIIAGGICYGFRCYGIAVFVRKSNAVFIVEGIDFIGSRAAVCIVIGKIKHESIHSRSIVPIIYIKCNICRIACIKLQTVIGIRCPVNVHHIIGIAVPDIGRKGCTEALICIAVTGWCNIHNVGNIEGCIIFFAKVAAYCFLSRAAFRCRNITDTTQVKRRAAVIKYKADLYRFLICRRIL